MKRVTGKRREVVELGRSKNYHPFSAPPTRSDDVLVRDDLIQLRRPVLFDPIQ